MRRDNLRLENCGNSIADWRQGAQFPRVCLYGVLACALVAPGCFVSETPTPATVTSVSRTGVSAPAALPEAETSPQEVLVAAPAELPSDELAALQPAKSDKTEKIREELFKGWPKPAVALVLTGQQHGYIEPCGCTGLANQKGGLARRHTLLKQLAADGWPLVPVDVGNQVRRFGRQAEIQFQMTAEGLKKMNYRAIGFGPDDLRLSVGELISATATSGENKSVFVSSNVALLDPELTPRYQIVSLGGKKIGITAALGSEAAKKVVSEEIIIQPAVNGLAAVWPKLKAEKCDLYILLANATLDESKALAVKFPDFDVVISAGGAGEPTHEPEKIPNIKTVMLQVGTKGMYAGVLGLFDGPGPKLRYQRVPLDDRFADSKDMLALLASYQKQLETAGLDGLGVKPLPFASRSKFVGSETCGECHTKAHAIWQKTPHATATESLVHPGERGEIARHFDPECLSCHVTGWNSQKYYPYASGFMSLADKHLHGNGCENCHGPGSAHVAAESDGKTLGAALKSLRASMRLPLAEAEKRCMDCHDLDNSPDFHVKGAFEKFWKAVEHKGKD